MKNRYAVTLAIVFCLSSWAGSAQAQVNKEETVNVAVTGTVTAIDTSAKTITVKGANDDGGIFVVDAKTTIMGNGPKKLGFSALEPKQHVAVDADVKNGKQIATYIEIVDSGE